MSAQIAAMSQESWEGFAEPTSEYFRLPNILVDKLFRKIKDGSAISVLIYVFRQTWGYQDYQGMRRISIDEFVHGRMRKDGTRMDEGIGLSDRTIKRALQKLIAWGYLVCKTDDSDKSRIKKYYGINMSAMASLVGGEGNNVPPEDTQRGKIIPITQGTSFPQGGTMYPSEDRNIPLSGNNVPLCQEEITPRSEKETSERHLNEKQRGKKDATRALLSSQINFEDLRVAQWSQGTIIALVADLLKIPAQPEAGSKALKRWQTNYQEPAQWLYEHTKDSNALYAAERLWRHVHAMLHGPTWHANNGVAFTLRNVVGWDKITGALSGANWASIKNDLDKAGWYPDVPVPYEGPRQPKDDEASNESPQEATQGAVASIAATEHMEEPVQQEPTTDEVPAVKVPSTPAGMSLKEATWLLRYIDQMCPQLIIAEVAPIGDERYVLAVQAADGVVFDIDRRAQWFEPDATYHACIEQALAYGEAHQDTRPGMSKPEAAQLAQDMLRDYPDLRIAGYTEVAPCRWTIALQCSNAKGDVVVVENAKEWYEPSSQEFIDAVEAAIDYGASCKQRRNPVEARAH